MMEDNKQLAQRIDGAIQSSSREVTNLRSELCATGRRLAELDPGSPPPLENHHLDYRDSSVHRRQKALVTDMCYNTDISTLANFGSPDCSLGKGEHIKP